MSLTKTLIKNITQTELIKLIFDLVKIPSHSPIIEQEKEVAEYIHSYFTKEGIDTELMHIGNGRYNVTAVIKGKNKGKKLLLTGHMDTVPPYDMENPYEAKLIDGNLTGRGAVDMKGQLACMMMTLVALKRSNIQLDGDLIFAGVADEEEKSLGTIALVESGLKPDAAIVGEPTDLEICIAHRGLEWLEFKIIGKAVHGGKQSEGINAIVKASNFISLLEKEIVTKLNNRIHPVAGCSTMNYGTITGGTQPSTVAGECIIRIDRRWIPGETHQGILKEYTDAIEKMKEIDPQFKCEMKIMDVSIMKDGYVHPAMEIDSEHQFVKILEKSTEEILGHKSKLTFFPAWTDGGLLYNYTNIPTIVFGPGNLETAHSKEECIPVNQLIPAVEIYLTTAINFCK